MRDPSGLTALALLVTLMSGLDAAATTANRCSDNDGIAAETLTDHLHSWQDMYSAYKQFKQCDDGGVAEGFSEAVARLLADHWANLPQALPLTSSDPAFEAWFIGHLDETDNNEDLAKIDHLAQRACPVGARKLCDKIHAHLKSETAIHSS